MTLYVKNKPKPTMVISMSDKIYLIAENIFSSNKFYPETTFICGIYGPQVKECKDLRDYIANPRRTIFEW